MKTKITMLLRKAIERGFNVVNSFRQLKQEEVEVQWIKQILSAGGVLLPAGRNVHPSRLSGIHE